MKIHEYQAKAIFREFGVAVPAGRVATTVDEAFEAATDLGGRVVVKAQIHAGGRGKGGGVKLADSPAEARSRAGEILGMMLKTHQTGPQGQLVRKVLVEEASQIARELYAGMVLDRETGRVTLMVSEEGGVEIEKVAHDAPEKIKKIPIDPLTGITPFQVRAAAQFLKLEKNQIKEAGPFFTGLYRAFVEKDASLVEINPLIVTKAGSLAALDGKMNFDDNALDRHPEIRALRDLAEEDPAEIEAAEANLSYVKLTGNIGCLVNGAGLAMATMDIIKQFGAEPANFLDVGGSADKERVTKAFQIILRDPSVKGILVNIFGGIVRCDVIAEGVVAATRAVGVKVPVVVRLEGTNQEIGMKILEASGLDIIAASGMEQAARKVTEAIR